MTGPEHVEPPGSNAELPEDDQHGDDEIEQEANHVYERITAPFGDQTATVREATTRLATEALASADAMDRIAEGERAIAQMEVDNNYQNLQLTPVAQETCRKSALALTVGAVLGGLIVGGAILAAYLSTAQDVANTPPPGPDDPAEDAFEAQMRRLVNAWQKLPEKEYWQSMENWVREDNPSWYRQRYVATYASTIARDETSGADLDVATQRIVDVWNRNNPDATQIYDVLTTAALNDVPLTRKEKLLALVRAINRISPPEST